MGAFPSHDAPELIYTTMVSRPMSDTRVEVCLVPLLPRFFNDSHKKVKKKLNDLLSRKGSNQSPVASSSATTNSAATSTPPVAGSSAANSTKRSDQGGNVSLVDCIISSTESFFFVNTKDAIINRDSPNESQQQKEKEKLGDSGSQSSAAGAGSSGTEPSTSQQQQPPPPPPPAYHATPHHSTPSLVRPVPFAVCLTESDGNSGDSSSPNQGSTGKHHHHQHQGPNSTLLTIKGQRLQLVGFISCCLDRQIHLINPSVVTKGHSVNGASCSSSSNSGTGDGKKRTLPVVLDVIFDDMESHAYLTESVVLLASFAFRKQFINSCALHYPAGDSDVEAAFDRHMERLRLHIVLRHDNYRGLRLFYNNFPLLDMITELGIQDNFSPNFSLYENSLGEYGLEVTFHSTFLSRWLRYVEKMMRVDSVNGNHVRCVVADLLRESQRLWQERQESGIVLDEEEENERLFGGALLANTIKRWRTIGEQSLLHQQSPPPLGGPLPPPPLMIFPAGAGAPGAPGGYWPQLPMMMGAPPGWPAGVVPFHPSGNTTGGAGAVMAAAPQYLIQPSPAGVRPPVFYAAPQPQQLLQPQQIQQAQQQAQQQMLQSLLTPAQVPYGMSPAAPQIVYVLPGGQLASATAPPAPQVYYQQPTPYAVPLSHYMYQQAQVQSPPPPPPPPPPPSPPQQQQQ